MLASLMLLFIGQNSAAEEIRVLSPAEAIAAMGEVEAATRQNFDAIETWQGTYQFHDIFGPARKMTVGPPGDERPVQQQDDVGTYEFAIDTASHCRFWSIDKSKSWLTVRDTKTDTDREIPYGTYRETYIQKPGENISFRPDNSVPIPSSEKEKLGRSSVRQVSHRAIATFDPFVLFGDGVYKTWRYMATSQIAAARNPDAFKVCEVQKDGQKRYTIEIQFTGQTPQDIMIVRWELAEEFAYNPVYHSRRKVLEDREVVTEETVWRYEQQGGVFIPSYYCETHRNIDGVLSFQNELKQKAGKTNEKLPDETFAASRLPLEDGDRLAKGTRRSPQVFYQGKFIDMQQYEQALAESN
ncbi:hypothetical protein C5Y97_25465 [Blastopirellula marina]|uniref:Uncharacterized protein n=2 Tax=Blastopirellula marina TaxID=124 RepID=A0A2S8F7W8_9BACT|nr:hypothetical protein C5Y98_25450 [Blastopirellula marina]PTL41785.1 hypothetical protein C5Y97_25465 [Blastopirellula marina]